MKNFSIILLVGLFGGISGSYFFNSINNQYFSNLSQTVNPSPTVSVDPISESSEKIVTKLSSSFVGIQAFSDNKIIRQGSGISVSSDGLVVTTADLYAPANALYQIYYDDKIIKGEVVAKDIKSNLMLLKTSISNANIADFDSSSNYQSGQDVLLLGKSFDLSKPIVVSQKAIISYTTDKSIILDVLSNNYLYGFGAVSYEGRIRGIVYLRDNKVNLINSEVIENFFKTYLSK